MISTSRYNLKRPGPAVRSSSSGYVSLFQLRGWKAQARSRLVPRSDPHLLSRPSREVIWGYSGQSRRTVSQKVNIYSELMNREVTQLPSEGHHSAGHCVEPQERLRCFCSVWIDLECHIQWRQRQVVETWLDKRTLSEKMNEFVQTARVRTFFVTVIPLKRSLHSVSRRHTYIISAQ